MKNKQAQAAAQRQARACRAAFLFVRDNNSAVAEKLFKSLPVALQRRLDEAFPGDEGDGVPESTTGDGETEGE